MARIINKTQHGIVFKCPCCDKIHIEFNNINLNFTEKQHREFSEYINNLDGAYWEKTNQYSVFRRKIRIPMDASHVCLMKNNDELAALRQLLSRPFVPAENDLVKQFAETWCFN